MDLQPGQQDARDNQHHVLWPAVVLALVVLAVVSFVLYWPTIHLPLLYDDLLHIRIAKSLDLASVWVPTQDFGFYRPLTFLPLLIIKSAFGYYPAELLHGINIVQHGLNVILLAFLSWRLWRKLHWAVASGLVLAVYPFSYQAIAVYGHNVHPATAMIILLGLHSYLQAINNERHRSQWWIASIGLFVLGLLSHESAVLFGVFAALVHWSYTGRFPFSSRSPLRRKLTQFIRKPWFYFLFAGSFYLLAYQFLPLSRAPQAPVTANALWLKFLYGIQSAVYPISWFGRWLPDSPNWAIFITLAGLAILLGLTAWSDRNQNNRLPLLMGWAWWLVAVLVIGIPLSADYLLHGPRLLYISSIGTAILWPVLLQPLWSARRAGRVLWALTIAFILITSWRFVRDRLERYALLTSPVQMVEAVMEGRSPDEGIVLINPPSWVAPAANSYPVGVELVAMLGDYLFIEELIEENLRANHPAKVVVVPELLDEVSYHYGVYQQREVGSLAANWAAGGSEVFLTRYLSSGPAPIHLGSLRQSNADDLGAVTIGPYRLLAAEATRCDALVKMTTTWDIKNRGTEATDIPSTLSLFVQLVGENGQLVDQADGPPLMLRPDQLQVPYGWQIVDNRSLLDPGSQGEKISLGGYDYIAGDRLPALGSAGNSLPDNAVVIDVGTCQR